MWLITDSIQINSYVTTFEKTENVKGNLLFCHISRCEVKMNGNKIAGVQLEIN